MRGAAVGGNHRGVALHVVAIVTAVLCGAGAALAQQPVCVPPPAGMVAWWPGDDNTLDIVGNDTGTWVGTAAYTAGEVADAFSLNGSSYVQAPSTPAVSPTGAITIDAWVLPQATSSSRIVDKITAGGSDGYLLDVLGGQLRLIIDSASVQAGTISAGTRYHVAGTYDGATLTVYVNGASVGSVGHTGAIPTNSLPVRIGADQTGANTFTGWIDEVEIYSRALSGSEIQAIYNAATAGKCKPQPIPAASHLALVALALLLAAAASQLLLRR